MKRNLSLIAAAALVSLSAGAEVKFVTPNNDLANYKGDEVKFPVTLNTRTVKLGGSQAPKDACLRRGTSLKNVGKGLVAVGKDKKDEEHALFEVADEGEADAQCDDTQRAKLGEIVAIHPTVLTGLRHDRKGWSFGTLTVPYKHQISGDRSLSGGASLGGYLGRRVPFLGISTQAIAFAGVTKVDVPTTKDGKPATDQLAGLSLGVGLLGTVKDSFQLGVVVGVDRVAKSAGYVNNGKPWVSLSLGYAFFD